MEKNNIDKNFSDISQDMPFDEMDFQLSILANSGCPVDLTCVNKKKRNATKVFGLTDEWIKLNNCPDKDCPKDSSARKECWSKFFAWRTQEIAGLGNK